MKGSFMKNSILFLTISLFIFSSYLQAQWIEQTLPGDIDVTLGIDFINQNHGVMGGWHFNFAGEIYGNAFYTTNAGTNWVEASIPDSMRVIVGIKMINDNIGYGAGAYNLSSPNTKINNYQQRKNLHLLDQKNFERIGMDFSGQENYRGYFVETTDGGLSWHPKGSFEDSVYYLVGISFIDQLRGFVIASSPGAASSAALATLDGGNTWNFVTNFQDGIFVRDIRFFEQIGYLIYENSIMGVVFITATTDGGITWYPPYQVGLISAGKVSYVNDHTILISGLKNQFESSVLRSTDAGTSWQEIRNYDIQHYISGVDAVFNSGTILAYGIYEPIGAALPFTDISLDSGQTWYYSQLAQFQDYSPFNSAMVDEQRWYLTGRRIQFFGFVLFTDNAGGVPVELISFTAEAFAGKVNLNWATATELNNLGFEVERSSDSEGWKVIGFKEGKGTTTETQNYSFNDDLFGITDTKVYYRLKQIDFDGSFEYSDIIEVEVEIPGEFSLSQNYPNPFNPVTNIKYSISSRQFVTLKVYDVLGNEIATLVNEELSAGEYEVEFDAAGLSSGIYIYRLQAGTFIETKRMMLLK